jgi:hypothetical protein
MLGGEQNEDGCRRTWERNDTYSITGLGVKYTENYVSYTKMMSDCNVEHAKNGGVKLVSSGESLAMMNTISKIF